MASVPPAVRELGRRLEGLGWVPELWVGGSLATGDYVPGVSDHDLVALVHGPVTDERRRSLAAVHAELDAGPARGLDLGCVYVDEATLGEPSVQHPTWTHGSMVDRRMSGIVRAELVRHGYAVHGREPQEVLPPMSADDVREAGRAEVCGYWAWASRRPLMWLHPVIADLGLTSMARGRHVIATGELLTKSEAVERAHAPAWLVDQLRSRRRGGEVVSPRIRTGWIAWRDARRTVAAARRSRSS